MPLTLRGSCRCGAVSFTCESSAPAPYQRCCCSICRKADGGGGYAINLGADAGTLRVEGREAVKAFRAEIRRQDGACELSTAERRFCARCGAMLFLSSPEWPELVHPFASAIDSPLPAPPSSVHMMLRFKPDWVEPEVGPQDAAFDLYPEQSLEEWHKADGVWAG